MTNGVHHMGKYQDLSGKKFGMLTALYRSENQNGRTMWMCKCDCGNTKAVEAYALKNGNTRSCGCIPKLYPNATKHGKCYTRLNRIWCGMKSRCNNTNDPHYKYYGAKGVKVCPEWENDFESFYKWSMEHGYTDSLTIERNNICGNYCPDNCRWATPKEQCNNRSTSRRIEYKGKLYTVAVLSEKFGIPYGTFYARIKRGWSVEEAVTGHKLTPAEIAAMNAALGGDNGA